MKAADLIRTYQQNWFEKIRLYLLGSNLNVGSGHGYFSQIAKEAGFNVTSLEVSSPAGVVNAADLILYDGVTMPFGNSAFEASLAMYVLHHTPNPEAVLREMRRVSQKRIILVEELYRNLPGKIRLALLDFSVNFKAGLKSEIHWNSYLTRDRLLKAVEKEGWKLVHAFASPQKGFDEVLWIIDKNV